MYKCPNCGQEMIDKKEFCLKCGCKLKNNEKEFGTKGLIIIFVVLIIAGVITCYGIANFGREDELKPYLPEKEITSTNEEIEEKELIVFPED